MTEEVDNARRAEMRRILEEFDLKLPDLFNDKDKELELDRYRHYVYGRRPRPLTPFKINGLSILLSKKTGLDKNSFLNRIINALPLDAQLSELREPNQVLTILRHYSFGFQDLRLLGANLRAVPESEQIRICDLTTRFVIEFLDEKIPSDFEYVGLATSLLTAMSWPRGGKYLNLHELPDFRKLIARVDDKMDIRLFEPLASAAMKNNIPGPFVKHVILSITNPVYQERHFNLGTAYFGDARAMASEILRHLTEWQPSYLGAHDIGRILHLITCQRPSMKIPTDCVPLFRKYSFEALKNLGIKSEMLSDVNDRIGKMERFNQTRNGSR